MKKIGSFLLVFPFLTLLAYGQICTGNLGDNIFTAGDFGSGSPNILLPDPLIAPGYLYDPTPPPDDGYYVITNNINAWANSFDWLRIQDNSPDPFGYMMVVNASFSTGLFYEQEVTGLCENTLYEFSVDVFNLIPSGKNYIKPNVSFLIDSVVVYNTGDVPENEQWNTYGFTFTTAPGQNTLTLSLQNNAPGGIGNDIALDNITFRPCGPEASILPGQLVERCSGTAPFDLTADIVGNQFSTPVLQWQESMDMGVTWTDIPGATNLSYTITSPQAGSYYYRYVLANSPSNLLNSKCRIISNVTIVEVTSLEFALSDTLCDGLTYPQGANLYTSTGIYVDSLVSSLGCDSIVTLDLTILQDPRLQAEFTVQDPACTDDINGLITLDSIWNGNPPYRYLLDGTPLSGGSNLSALPAGTYPYTILDRFGCRLDTILELINPAPFTISLEPDASIELGDEVEVITTGNYPIGTYSWLPANLVPCVTQCSPISIYPAESLVLTLNALSENNCEATDSIFIEVTPARRVFFPTGFTPNGDGLNDYFMPVGAVPNVVQVDVMVIFDRWGKVVFRNDNFSLDDPTAGWNGTAQGKAVPQGVYTYLTEIRFLDEVVISKAGSVTLIR